MFSGAACVIVCNIATFETTHGRACAEGIHGAARRKQALELIRRLPQDDTFIPVQAIGELFRVLTRKAGFNHRSARNAILDWCDSFGLIETSAGVMAEAFDLAHKRHLGIWDSVVLAAAAEAGCRLLLSEELREAFTWHGGTVANPFLAPGNSLLSTLLEGPCEQR